MATAQLQKTDPIAQLSSILDLISGTDKTQTTGPTATSTSGGTTTTKGNLTMDQMTQIIQQILGGSQGLASVAMGQKASGGYNTTVNTQLINDLMSRVSTQVAAANAGTTTTKSPETTTKSGETTTVSTPGATTRLTSQAGMSALGAGALSWLLAPAAKAAAKKTGLSNIPEQLSNILTGGNVAATTAETTLAGETAGKAASISDTAGLSEAFSNLSGGDYTTITNALSTAFPDAMDFTSSGSAMANLDTTGLGEAWSGIDLGGSSGLTDAATSVATDIGSSAGLSELGTAGADAIASVAADTGLEEAAAAAALTVICTESVRQGLMSKELYAKESLYIHPRLSETTLRGYHFWAVFVVKWMRQSPKAALFFAFCARQYLSYCCENTFSITGFLCKHIGENICTLIGAFVKDTNVKEVLYA